MILYQGPSALDGAPIVCIATGFGASRNPKTGAMIQTWIMRADIEPHQAVKTGADSSVCGDCPLRPQNASGKRRCYVKTWQAPLSVYRTFKRGVYQAADFDAFDGRRVRIGSYGDPAAVPVRIWRQIISRADKWTGYTHQWRKRKLAFLMASCDSELDLEQAQARGYRTFRTLQPDEKLALGEISCPASKEAGHRTTCEKCGLCAGAGIRAKNIAIALH